MIEIDFEAHADHCRTANITTTAAATTTTTTTTTTIMLQEKTYGDSKK